MSEIKKTLNFGAKWGVARITSAIAILLVIIFTWAYVREIRRILQQPVSSWTEDTGADCAVVVTGGPNRVREGVDLLARKVVQKLIISGVHPQAGLRDIFALWPFYGELHDQDVILERRSRTTFGNAQQSLPLVEALRCRDLLLITSRTHMQRALKTFRAEFPSTIQIIPRAVVSTTIEPSWTEVGIEAFKSLFYSVWAY
jgi:uncharacterized SAM-binding protein YcdF (DUF218 family)